MKKINKLILFLLILPICISFSACKKKDKTDNSNQNQIEQPTPDTGGGEDDGGQTPPTVETYSVSFDYNLPEDYDYLLADKDFSVNYKEVGTSTSLAKVPDQKLQQHFLGWCEEGSDTILSGSITSNTSKTIKLKGKWNETTLRKYYYSDGLSFDIVDGDASVLAYSGSSRVVIIPQVFTLDEVDYNLTEIQAGVFEDKNIEKVILNAEDINIGNNAFKNTRITDFNFAKVKTIGESAFENTNFVNLSLDDNISICYSGAFKNCKELVSVDFSNNSTFIADYMFYGCDHLTTISNALNITRIGEYAFAECVSLKNTDFVGPRVKIISSFAFQNCAGLVSITLPETLSNINEAIFDGCTSISELRIGQTFEIADNATRADNLLNHIGEIGDNVTKITLIGDSIQRLSKNYFDGFTKLETFIMTNSVTTVESYAFRECSLLENITLSNNLDLESFTYLAFYGTKFLNDRTTPLIYANQIMYVPNNIVPDYTLPSGVTRIHDGAFVGNNSLKKITIPASVSSIGSSAFQNCANLEMVVFEENFEINEIATNTFYGCSKLSSVNLSALKALTRLGDNSFRGVRISNFIIPSTVTEIGDSAFLYSSVESFEIDGISTKFVVEDDILYELNGARKTLINYPVGKQGELFICPGDVTNIASYAFSNVLKLKYVYFSSEIEWIPVEVSGNTYYKSFDSAVHLKLLSEDNGFNTTEISEIYRYCSSNVSYDFSSGEVTLESGFTSNSNFVYIKIMNPSTSNLNFICFEIEITGEGESTSYLVKQESVFVIETEF